MSTQTDGKSPLFLDFFDFLALFSGGFRAANRLIYQAKKGGIGQCSRFFSQNHFSLHKGAGMAGKMLVERTIFWPGRSGTDAPLRRRSGRGKTGGGSLATGGAGRHRERYSRERGQGRKDACLPGQGREAIAGPWRGWGGLWPCFCPNHLAGDGAGGRRLWGRYERKAPQPQPRRRTAHDGEGDSSYGTFLKRAAGRSYRRGKGTCGRWQRRREGPSPGRSARSAPSVTKGAPRASVTMRAGLLDP